MKYDNHGVSCGLEDMEHTKNMLSKKDAREYFQRLKDELPWSEITWHKEGLVPRLVFNYNELERVSHKCPILEELTLLIEETYETNVCGVGCNYYRNGDDYRKYHNKRKRHLFILSFGEPRKMIARKRNSVEGKIFKLSSGDSFYSSRKTNSKYEFSSPREPMIINSRIELSFFTDKPYIKREQHLRYINVLGVGKIPMWFQGEECRFPEDATAVILPASFVQMVGGTINPLIDNFDSPVEIIFEQMDLGD